MATDSYLTPTYSRSQSHLRERAKDWYDVLGYTLVQGEETDFERLKQALKESFLTVRNKAEFLTKLRSETPPLDLSFYRWFRNLKTDIRSGKPGVRVIIVKDEIEMRFEDYMTIVGIEIVELIYISGFLLERDGCELNANASPKIPQED
ncbi:hypothetical protein TNCV_545151 [Trichonephila clavipes]|nr:hypothetical protein TNCV_545151 [Trichonephila clavipes]